MIITDVALSKCTAPPPPKKHGTLCSGSGVPGIAPGVAIELMAKLKAISTVRKLPKKMAPIRGHQSYIFLSIIGFFIIW